MDTEKFILSMKPKKSVMEDVWCMILRSQSQDFICMYPDLGPCTRRVSEEELALYTEGKASPMPVGTVTGDWPSWWL